MALHIRDAETDRLVRLLAERKGVPLTEAIKVAVRNELEREEQRPGLWERLKPLHERVAARPSTGLAADKAFFDGLSDD
jgi:antitoxin VapB